MSPRNTFISSKKALRVFDECVKTGSQGSFFGEIRTKAAARKIQPLSAAVAIFRERKIYRLNLSIAMLPISLNRKLRSHRFKLAAENKAWDSYMLAELRGKLPPEPLQRACIKLTRYAHKTLDYDGLVGSMKPVVDALVTAGALSDDSWKVLGAWEVTQEFRPKKDGPLLAIELVEIQCEP